MKKLCLSLVFVSAGLHAGSVSFSNLIDPAPDAFCTDVAHPVCLKLTQIQFSGLSQLPTDVDIEDENGDVEIFDYSNLVANVDPNGTTYSGSITPDQAFSITTAENVDFQAGLLYLDVSANSGAVDLAGVSFSAADALSTPEPGSGWLLLMGLVAIGLAGRAGLWKGLLERYISFSGF
jgi:hypothetical protein